MKYFCNQNKKLISLWKGDADHYDSEILLFNFKVMSSALQDLNCITIIIIVVIIRELHNFFSKFKLFRREFIVKLFTHFLLLLRRS